jgi:CRP/FNR family transcriptional regulator, cyclic AMP receptor protein
LSTQSVDKNRIVLIVTESDELRRWYSRVVQTHVFGAKIYTASDGREALFKVANVPPSVLITDAALPTISGLDLVTQVLQEPRHKDLSIIIATQLPEKEMFIDSVVSGQVQFFVDQGNEVEFDRQVVKALNRLTHLNRAEYFIRFMASQEVLFRQGDACDAVYIVKRGRLRAVRKEEPNGETVVLGEIMPGEFVGEMAHINRDKRSATVEALESCELIEIPDGTLDLVLFSKPAWSRALIQTLSLRLKRSNEALAKRENARLSMEDMDEGAESS